MASGVSSQGEQTPDNHPKRAVICGGGVIGASTAYFLAKKGFEVTIVEKFGVACAASGKAGGFLALDWSSGAEGKLAQASFKLHEQLADEFKKEGLDYGYRKVNALSLDVRESINSATTERKANANVPSWIDGPLRGSESIGTPASTAQVHPKMFTQALIDAAVSKHGAKLVIGEVQDIATVTGAGGTKVVGVLVDGNILDAEVAVVAMGPWSSKVKLVGQLTKISALKANSIVLRPQNPSAVTAHMLFLQYKTREGKLLDPEIYPRPSGEVYVCGLSEQIEIPDNPEEVQPSNGAPAMLHRAAATTSNELRAASLEFQQACCLPCSSDGTPLIGALPGVYGAYVATGHSCWGILNAPATGASLAELIADGQARTVDLKSFSPKRFLAGPLLRQRH